MESATNGHTNQKLIAALEQNWHAEMEGAATYRELATLEKDQRRQALLNKLAEAEERHAKRWSDRIVELGGNDPTVGSLAIGPSRSVTMTARVSDLDTALRRIEATEDEHVRHYKSQVEEFGDPALAEILRELAADESTHARTLRTMTGADRDPQTRLDHILGREKWHRKTGNWIGDAIYGINDGLTAVFGIVAGIAGATTDNHFIVLGGLAGALSSALSMGASAYLANKAEREVFEAELSRERHEVEDHPDEEREELELFYQLKGFSEEESKSMVERIAQKPDAFLHTLAKEELGLSEEQLPNPYMGAVIGTASTAIGGIVPVLPFFFLAGMTGVWVSLIVSVAAHFAVGASKSIVTLRRWWVSGAEMTVVAVVVAAVAYALGTALGAH